jgi:hypothetical protein
VDAPPVITYYVIPALLGCPYTSKAQLLRPDFGDQQGRDIGAQDGPAFGRVRRIATFAAEFSRTRAISIGTDFDKTLTPVKLTKFEGGPSIGKTDLFSGIAWDTLKNNSERTSQIAWQQERPTPGTILAMGGFVKSSET